MYFAPYVDATGLHLPTFDDISSYEIEQFLAVFGQSVYNGNDTADLQWIKIFSLMINDAFNTAQLVTNGRAPSTAIGGDLDSIVKVNGITRKSATSSTAVLTISGISGTVINSGVAQDINNFLWNLPLSVTIPGGGSINVTATCESIGAVSAPPNTINFISTPTSGWNGVTNAAQAVPGQPVETDSQLRARQAISVSLSAKTLVDSTLAGIAAVPGVTRYGTVGVENPTGSVDSYGNPAHSISMVVEGGTDLAVATAIYNNKTPGCFTNGTTSVVVTDPVTGSTMNIGFFRPTYKPIYVSLSVHPLAGYSSAVTAAIQNAVTNYLNSLQIGESLTISALYGAAVSVMPNLSLPQFSVQALTAGVAPAPVGTVDIPVLFNEVVSGLLANVIITLV